MSDARSETSASENSLRRRSAGRAILVMVVGLTIYVLAYVAVPPFRDYVQDGLQALGLYDKPADPGVRDLVVNERGRFLWGGSRESDHFDINVFRLDTDQLHYGLGRERFTALLEPAFVPLAELMATNRADQTELRLEPTLDDRASPDAPASARWPGAAARVLAVHVGDVVKVYPLALLRRHEVINDVVGGVPIFAAYCYLADLAAVYDRRLGPHTLTFAVSGYTYFDPQVWDGRDAFLLWDRDTESLWWPPIGRAVSGPLVDTPMRLLDQASWSQMTWQDAQERYPDALVLERHQSFTPPSSWPQLDTKTIEGTTPPAGVDSIAPPWGAAGR